MLKLTEQLKDFFIDTAKKLKNADRRMYMAQVVALFDHRNESFTAKELNWNRGTIRKGKNELKNIPLVDNFSQRGRKKSEVIFPNLLDDIHKIVNPESQTDPSFKSCRLYTRLTAKEVRKQLIKSGLYDDSLPSERTISTKLNELGYHLKKVQKTKPHKKIPEVDAIFEQTHKANKQADCDPKEIRISIDAKAKMNIGDFSRGGRNRVLTKAEDHDLGVKTKLTPFGFFIPQHNDFYLFFTEGPATSDFIVDCLEEIWPVLQKKYGAEKLTFNADNGMDNSSLRTQFMKRLVEFSGRTQTKVKLAYYPPYHSKYNPVERVWGIYEKHIQGDIMDTVETTIKFAKSMTYNGQKPLVKLVDAVYKTGISVTKKGMRKYNKFVHRLNTLEKWCMTISPGYVG
jgi:hypothetical protein